MSFTLPGDLAPELYPLAWLLGTWRGPGQLAYPGISEHGVVAEMVVTHDGGPYLAYEATLFTGERLDHEEPYDPAALVAEEVWGRESGFWRPVSTEARPVAGAPADGPAPSALEVLLSDPSGHAAVLTGSVQGPRIDLASDWVAATATSPARPAAMRRMYGWVRGEIFWAWDLAAFGHELDSYASGRLSRLESSARPA